MASKNDSPRILFVTPFWPQGPEIGSRVRSLNVLRALRKMGTVEVVVLDDENAMNANDPAADGEFAVAYRVPVLRQANEGWKQKLRWTIDPKGPYPNGCRVSEDAVRRLRSDLESFDLVWFFKLRSPDMFPPAVWNGSVVDIDDVPSTFEHAKLKTEHHTIERLRIRRSLFAWKRREKLLGDRFTVLSVCSPEDKQYLERMGLKAPIHVIPNGYERPVAEPLRNLAAPPRIGFIGLFDYFPNLDAIQWFVNRCWPLVKNEVPEARLRLVGLGSDQANAPKGPDIDGLGWLPDPGKEIGTWSAMVAPIRVGAGTRVKVAQAFSQKCPLVSTTLGAFGYHPVDGHNMYLADSAEDFAAGCIRAIGEPEAAAKMAERAWCEFLENWTWEAIEPRVRETAEDCLRLKKRG